MTIVSEYLDEAEIARYRELFQQCRDTSIRSSDKAIGEILELNSATLRRIDAGMAALVPRPGESPNEHRDRIDAAFAAVKEGLR